VAVVIEWGSELGQILPPDRIKLKLIPTSRGSREVEINYPERYAYLFKDVF
jgi:tRNA A37 threonylcarbamoyladenosine biosynthesis protein TsaE